MAAPSSKGSELLNYVMAIGLIVLLLWLMFGPPNILSFRDFSQKQAEVERPPADDAKARAPAPASKFAVKLRVIHTWLISDGTGRWTYGYRFPSPTRATLTTVTLPDSSRWTIDFKALADTQVEYAPSSSGG